MTDREEFLQIFRQHVTRPGSEKLLDWLDHKTDFFSAPASTRFHGAGQYSIVGIAPKVAPFRIDFDIDLYLPVLFISPQKRFFAAVNSNQLPVGIAKWGILIRIRKG